MEAPRNRRLAALHHVVAANRRRAELARWDEFRERLQSIRPRSKAKRWRCWNNRGQHKRINISVY